MRKIPLIIDCDPGCDDAIALLLAFKNEILDIKGVTVSAGNVGIDRTLENARRIAGMFRKDVPVFKGCEKPLFKTIVTAPEVHGESGLGKAKLEDSDKKIEDINAIEFIAKTLKESDEKVNIAITGPMTNIAVFLMQYPNLKSKIEKFIIMGGSSIGGNVTPSAEFNIYVDAEAAEIVFNSGVNIVLCPLDVTMKAVITEKDLEEIRSINNKGAEIATGAIETVLDFYREVYNKNSVPMHDPCTIAYLLNPNLFNGQKVFLDVETKGKYTYGETIIDYKNKFNKTPNALVLNEVNREEFVKLIVDTLKRY